MPTISLTNPTALTVITAGLHSSNYTTIQTLLNGNIDNANINAAAGISQSKIAFSGWQDYTPTVNAGFAFGSGGFAEGRYTQIGKTVIGSMDVYSGTSPTVGTGSSTFLVTLPTNHRNTRPLAIGAGRIFIGSTIIVVSAEIGGGLNTFNLNKHEGSLPLTHSDVTAFWDLHLQFTYEAA